MIEGIGKLTIGFIIFLGSAFVTLLGAHVVIDVSGLYKLDFISTLGMEKVYGLIMLTSFVLTSSRTDKTESKDTTFAGFMGALIGVSLSRCASWLFLWGLMYLFHFMLFHG
jgi:hypothetical protein